MMKTNTYILTGFYGSGKTEFALNLAMHFANQGTPTTLADLDVINPYIRSRERQASLEKLGIRVVASSLNNHTGQDIPALSFGFTAAITRGEHVIIDLGGSESGIKVLPAFSQFIQHAHFFCVVNPFRPETDSAQKIIEFIHLINGLAPLSINGLINNGHLLTLTEPNHVLTSQHLIKSVSDELGIPLVYTHLAQNHYPELRNQLVSQEILTFHKLQMHETFL